MKRSLRGGNSILKDSKAQLKGDLINYFLAQKLPQDRIQEAVRAFVEASYQRQFTRFSESHQEALRGFARRYWILEEEAPWTNPPKIKGGPKII